MSSLCKTSVPSVDRSHKTRLRTKAKKIDDAGEPALEDGDIEELSDSEMLLNRESNPGLPRLVGVDDKRKS